LGLAPADENFGHRKRVGDVGVPSLAQLSLVGGGGKVINRLEAFFVEFDLILLDRIKQIGIGHG